MLQQLHGLQVHFPPDEQASQHLQLFLAHGQTSSSLQQPIFKDVVSVDWLSSRRSLILALFVQVVAVRFYSLQLDCLAATESIYMKSLELESSDGSSPESRSVMVMVMLLLLLLVRRSLA